MQNALLNFLRSALVPELCAYISAGAAGNIHFILVGITAVGATPNEFAVGILYYFNFAVPTAVIPTRIK